MPYSHHPYVYALSNPVLFSDPTGKYAVNEDGLRESRRCVPGTYADPRTGRCWGSGGGGGGNWGGNSILGAGGVVTAVQAVEYVVAGTEYVVGQTASKLPIFCEVPILVLTRDQLCDEQCQRFQEAILRGDDLVEGQPQPEAQPQPQPLTSQPTPQEDDQNNRLILFHYGTADKISFINASQTIPVSLEKNNPQRARYGDGIYFTELSPGSMNKARLARALYGNPWPATQKSVEAWVAVDVTGLTIIPERTHVYRVPTTTELPVAGRIVGTGSTP